MSNDQNPYSTPADSSAVNSSAAVPKKSAWGRNIAAVVVGIVGGSVVNLGIIMIGPLLIANPHMEGVDTNDMEAFKAAMVNFEPQHFMVPFVAHAAGTLVGAYLAAAIAGSHKLGIAMTIGFWFLLGGVLVSFLLPAPGWFIGLDLIVAYLPMAWLAGSRFSAKQPTAA